MSHRGHLATSGSLSNLTHGFSPPITARCFFCRRRPDPAIFLFFSPDACFASPGPPLGEYDYIKAQPPTFVSPFWNLILVLALPKRRPLPYPFHPYTLLYPSEYITVLSFSTTHVPF